MSETFHVAVQAHPLRTETIVGDVLVGSSLEEMGAGECVLAFVDGDRVTDLSYRPYAGQMVALKAVPAGVGDGKDPLRLVATLALIYVTSGVASGAIGGLSGTTALFASTAISIAGNLAINALIPPPTQNLDELNGFEPFRNGATTSNTITPFGVIPRLYGTHRMFPPMAGRPYTEQAGPDQYMRLLFCLGYGPLDINEASFRLGDTALSQYESQVEILQGAVGDPPLTLYGRNIAEQGLNDPFNLDGDTITRTTASGARQISIDIGAPALLLTGDQGRKVVLAVGFKVEFRPAGVGGWTPVSPANASIGDEPQGGYSANFPRGPGGVGNVFDPINGSNPDGSTGIACYYLQGKDYKPFRLNILIDTPTEGSYDVRVTRIAAYSGSPARAVVDGVITATFFTRHQEEPQEKLYSEFAWTAIRAIGADIAQTVPPGLAFVAMRIKLTDQLNGVVNNFSCVATSRLPVWTGAAFVEQPTSNPAWIYRDIMHGSANGRPIDVPKIDDAQLKIWASDCNDASRQFNAIFDGRTTVHEALKNVASAGRAAFSIKDGLYSVVQDKPGEVPVQLFTPRNSWGFSWNKSFVRQPDALKVKFKDRDGDWEDSERIVYADGYSESGAGGTLVAEQFEPLVLFGVTDKNQVWKDTRYHMAVSILRPERFTWNADVGNLVCLRGSVVRYQHDALLLGLGSGRIKSIAGSTVTLDEQLVVEVGKTYQLRVIKDDAVQVLATITNAPGTYNTLTLSGGVPAGVKVGDLAAFGETGKVTMDCLITGIDPLPDLQARITAVPYSPDVFDAESGTIPPYDPLVTKPSVTPPAPIILNVLSGPNAALEASNGALTYRIIVSYLFPSSEVSVQQVEGALKRDSTLTFEAYPIQSNGGIYTFIVPDAESGYTIRLRGISEGTYGPWTESSAANTGNISEPLVSLTLQEQPNSPVTPNGDLSTVIAKVEPPPESLYYDHAIVEYRRDDSTAWLLVGATDASNQARVMLNTDGTSYEFRARAVSIAGFEDSDGPVASITLSVADGQPPDPDTAATPNAALNVTGLRVNGQAPGVLTFAGESPKFTWNDVTPPAGHTLRDYRVRIIDPATSHVMRIEYAVAPQFIYTLPKNTADSAAQGYTTPRREFTVEIKARTVQGSISAAAAAATFNNPPPVLPGDFTHSSFFTAVELSFSRPTDNDFVGTKVYMSTVSGFTPGPANLVYNGVETTPVIINNLSAGTTYYYRIVLRDSFGDGSPSSQFSDLTGTLPGGDTTPPAAPTGLTLSSSITEAKLYTTAKLVVDWTPSIDDSGYVEYELEYWTDPAFVTADARRSSALGTVSDYTVFPAQVGATYFARVRALDAAQNASAWTATASHTITGDGTAPAVVNVGTASATGLLDKVLIEWVNPTDADFLQTSLYRGTSSGFTPGSGNLLTTTRATSYVDAEVVNGTAYYYKFITRDVSGNASAASAAVGPATPFRISSANIPDYVSPGAVTADILAVGNPGNIIWNSVFGDPTLATFDGWGFGQDDGGGAMTGGTLAVESTSTGMSRGIRNAVMARDTLSVSQAMYSIWAPDGDWDRVLAVVPGERIQASFYGQSHRCILICMLEFSTAAGVPISGGTNVTLINSGELNNVNNGAAPRSSLDQFTRVGRIATAPATAAFCRFYVRMVGLGTASPASPAYGFFTQAMFGRALPNQTQLDSFVVGGITTVGGGVIRTNAIIARHITANEVDTIHMRSLSITTSKLAAGAATFDKIDVSQLSAISGNLGSITAGTITGALIQTSASNPRVSLSSFGLFTINGSGNATAHLDPTGSGYLGLAPGLIQWDSLGNVTFNASVTSNGTIIGPLFKTTGTWSMEMGAQMLSLTGEPPSTVYAQVYRNGSTGRFMVDQTGNITVVGKIVSRGGSGTNRRIVIDGSDEMQYYDDDGYKVASVGISSVGGDFTVARFGSSDPASEASAFLGLYVESRTGYGIVADSNTQIGIWGRSQSNDGVVGQSNGAAGVRGYAFASDQPAVYGTSEFGQGLQGVGLYGAIARQYDSNTEGGSLVLEAFSSNTSAPTHTAKAGAFCVRFNGSGGRVRLYMQTEGGFGGTGNFWHLMND